ncbi:MAG: hypothetical protein K6A40_03180 [Solobacterium sp.]|nr:hypothetical protein [Solobacterium sp.]
MRHLQYIFVHGLSGWGSYDDQYKKMPYWGMRGGDLIAYLRNHGFDCYAASVAPTGSAWDRACELYAQLAGTRVDYGEAHSVKYGHERWGKDFTGIPLIPDWSRDSRIVLLGHSFGGATIRLFSQLLADGNEMERRSQDVSPFFTGGMADRIHNIVTLASPMNGTTAYDMFHDPGFDPDTVKVSLLNKGLTRLMAMGTKPDKDGRDQTDYADFDMHLDNAAEMNRRIPTLPHVYYFSVPCSLTVKQSDGTYVPEKGMEPLFVQRSAQMGAYAGTTAGGIIVDESWRDNDGLVNTISAAVPSGAPSKPLDRALIEKGIWNVFPVQRADHMWMQGGLMKHHDIREFYLDLLKLIPRE